MQLCPSSRRGNGDRAGPNGRTPLCEPAAKGKKNWFMHRIYTWWSPICAAMTYSASSHSALPSGLDVHCLSLSLSICGSYSLILTHPQVKQELIINKRCDHWMSSLVFIVAQWTQRAKQTKNVCNENGIVRQTFICIIHTIAMFTSLLIKFILLFILINMFSFFSITHYHLLLAVVVFISCKKKQWLIWSRFLFQSFDVRCTMCVCSGALCPLWYACFEIIDGIRWIYFLFFVCWSSLCCDLLNGARREKN